MKCLKSVVGATLLAVAGLASSGAQAAQTTYNSRAAFEAALASFSTDSLDGIQSFFHGADSRTDFGISTPFHMFGCINQNGCGDNSGIGFDSAYMWTYIDSPVTFTFNTPTYALGMDYGNPTCCGTTSMLVLNGKSSGASFGFFGVISDVALTTFTESQTDAYLLIDNLTYGAAGTPAPEPAGLALVGLAMAGAATARHRKVVHA